MFDQKAQSRATAAFFRGQVKGLESAHKLATKAAAESLKAEMLKQLASSFKRSRKRNPHVVYNAAPPGFKNRAVSINQAVADASDKWE